MVFNAAELAQRIFDANHPISAMLADLQRLDVARMIEGQEKQ